MSREPGGARPSGLFLDPPYGAPSPNAPSVMSPKGGARDRAGRQPAQDALSGDLTTRGS